MTLFLFQKKVIFSARRTSGRSFNGTIAYDHIDVNFGGGLQSNGKFIAPESGTYGFTLSGRTGVEKNKITNVKVYKDTSFHHSIYDGNRADRFNNINSSWMMKLAKGQVVHLEVAIHPSYGKLSTTVIFTGNLLMLDE